MENLDPDVLFGVEVLNEPAGFYDDIWTAVQDQINPEVGTITSPASQVSLVPPGQPIAGYGGAAHLYAFTVH